MKDGRIVTGFASIKCSQRAPPMVKWHSRRPLRSRLVCCSCAIGNYRPLYINVAGTERQDEVIIGRYVLNQFIVLLNAPGFVVVLFE